MLLPHSEIMETWILHERNEIATEVQQTLRELGLNCPQDRMVDLCLDTELAVDPFVGHRLIFVVFQTITPEHLLFLQTLLTAGDCKVIVLASITDPDAILQLFRVGVSDVIRWSNGSAEEIRRVVARIQSESIQHRCNGSLIGVIPTASATDSNLLACNLAASISEHLGTCSLIDMRVGGGDLAAMLKIDPQHTLQPLMTKADGVDASMVDQAMTPHPCGIQLLASPPLCSRFTNLKPRCCETILNIVAGAYACSVVHLEDPIQADDLDILESFDAIVLATRLDFVSLLRTKEYLRFLRNKQTLPASFHVVAMATGHAGELPIRSVEKLLNVNTIRSIPDDPVSVTVSLNMGNPVVLESPHSNIAKALRETTWTIPCIRDLLPSEASNGSPVPKGLLTSLKLSLVSGLIAGT